MKVLTPAALTPHGGSLRLLCLVFRTSNPQPRYGPEHRFRSRLNALGGSCDPGFAMNEQARRTMPPKRVRHPAGCSFASSCSPPRIAATQLPSATCATTSHRTDFHPPDKATSQTHSSPRKRGSSRGDTTKLRRKPGSRRERRKAAKLVASWYSGCSRSRACGVPTCAEATIARRPTSLNLLRRLLSIALARAVRGK
jgi:hypothetical protein